DEKGSSRDGPPGHRLASNDGRSAFTRRAPRRKRIHVIGRCSWWLDSATLPLPRRGTVLVLKELIQASYRGAVGNNTFLSPTRDVFDGPPRALRRGRRTRIASPDGGVERDFEDLSTGIGTFVNAPYPRLDPIVLI